MKWWLVLIAGVVGGAFVIRYSTNTTPKQDWVVVRRVGPMLVSNDSIVTEVFSVANPSAHEDMILEVITASCSCFEVDIKPKVVPPRSKATVTLSASGLPGGSRLFAQLKTNLKSRPLLSLELHITALTPIATSPARFDALSFSTRELALPFTVVAYSSSKESTEIPRIAVAGPVIVRQNQAHIAQEGGLARTTLSCTLTIRVDDSDERSGKGQIRISYQGRSETRDVSWVRQEPIFCSPDTIVLYTGSPTSSTVDLRLRSDVPITITSVEFDDQVFCVGKWVEHAAFEHVIPVGCRPELLGSVGLHQAVETNLVIKTDHPTQAETRVRAFVLPRRP